MGYEHCEACDSDVTNGHVGADNKCVAISPCAFCGTNPEDYDHGVWTQCLDKTFVRFQNELREARRILKAVLDDLDTVCGDTQHLISANEARQFLWPE